MAENQPALPAAEAKANIEGGKSSTPGKKGGSKSAPKPPGKVVIPSVFTKTRAIEVTDAVMTAVYSDGTMVPINIYSHRMRATHSEAVVKDGKTGNIAFYEMAKLPRDCDTLTVNFGAKILPLDFAPNACDGPEWYSIFNNITKASLSDGILFAARMVAYNILNGSWLCRNRDTAIDASLDVSFGLANNTPAHIHIEDVLDWPLRPVVTGKALQKGQPDPYLIPEFATRLEPLAQAIFESFMSETRKVLTINVVARATMLLGDTVHPSQLFLPPGKKDKETPSRQFFKVSINDTLHAALVAEKINNALRTYDRTYDPVAGEHVIPVEPNGSFLKLNTQMRSENSLYAILKKIGSTGGVDGLTSEERVFFVGCFIRGGVFNGESVKKKKADAGETAAEPGEDLSPDEM